MELELSWEDITAAAEDWLQWCRLVDHYIVDSDELRSKSAPQNPENFHDGVQQWYWAWPHGQPHMPT